MTVQNRATLDGFFGPNGSYGITGQHIQDFLDSILLTSQVAVQKVSEVVVDGTPDATVTFDLATLLADASFRDFGIVVRGRANNAATSCSVFLRVNGDSTTVYDYETREANGSTIAQAGTVNATKWHVGYVNGANAQPGAASFLELRVFDFQGTTFHKGMTSRSGIKNSSAGPAAADMYDTSISGFYRGSTNALTSAEISLSAGSLIQNSIISLYGYR